MELLEQIWTQRFFLAAVILFCIGAFTLFFHPNLIKKIIGFDLMDGAIYLMLTSVGYVRGEQPPSLPTSARVFPPPAMSILSPQDWC